MKSVRRERLINVAFILVVVGLLASLGGYYYLQCRESPCPTVAEFVAGFGAWAPVIYALLYIASSPIPFIAPVMTAAGGLLFGTLWGTVNALLVATLSSLVPFFLARRLGREWVARKVEGHRLEEAYRQSKGEKGFLFVLLMRLIPVLPWEIQNYVAGLTRIALPTFMAATIVGIIPGTFSLVFLGSSIGNPSSWRFYAAIALKVVTALIPIVAIWIRNRRKRSQPEILPQATAYGPPPE